MGLVKTKLNNLLSNHGILINFPKMKWVFIISSK